MSQAVISVPTDSNASVERFRPNRLSWIMVSLTGLSILVMARIMIPLAFDPRASHSLKMPPWFIPLAYSMVALVTFASARLAMVIARLLISHVQVTSDRLS